MRADALAALALEHQLLLRAALGAPAEASDAWREWRHRVDFDAIDTASQRLLPLLARRNGVIPTHDPVSGRIRGLYRRTWARNQCLWDGVRPAVEALAQRRIPLLLVGEAALVGLSGDTGTRSIQTLTMAVGPGRRAEALNTLTLLGWRPRLVGVRRRLRWRLMPSGDSWSFTGPDDAAAAKPLGLCLGAPWAVADPMAWQGAQPLVVAGILRQLQHPGDLLLQLTLEGAISCQRLSPQWVADVMQLLRMTAPEAMAARIQARFRDRRLPEAFRTRLRAAGELLEDPAPAALLARLER
jgi:hypothetical protein